MKSQLKFEIRKAKRNDFKALVEFQLAMALETEKLRLDPHTVKKGVAAVLKDPKKGKYWVAEHGSALIGCLLTIPEWSDWRNGTVLWIHSVYVQKKYRGRAVFPTMYALLKSQVIKQSSLRGLRLYVDRRNQLAARVYEKIGMNRDHYQLYEWLKES